MDFFFFFFVGGGGGTISNSPNANCVALFVPTRPNNAWWNIGFTLHKKSVQYSTRQRRHVKQVHSAQLEHTVHKQSVSFF